MPYAKSGDINIYYEVEGEGIPLLLAHGGAANLKLWRNYNYTDNLKDDYQLILFDFRAHGKSDRPYQESDYGSKLADDVIAVLDDMKISEVNYFGFSTGGLIGLWLATHYPERFTSFILIGMGAYGFPEPMVSLMKTVIRVWDLLVTDKKEALQEWEKLYGRILSDKEQDEFLARDGKALGCMFRAQLNMPTFSNDELAAITKPCLICCGELDPHHKTANETAKHIPNAKFVSLSGLDHATSWSQSDIVLPHINEFLSRANK